ncbi:MAG: endolytic transglycosylase MltG [Bacilli bacterium]|jgi:UPF0755 protein
MSKIIKIIIGIIVLVISLILLLFSYYLYQLSPTSSDKTIIEVEIPKGSTASKAASILKANHLIRDVIAFKVYVKIHNIETISYGIYELNRAMGTKQIINILSGGNTKDTSIKIMFSEGKNMRRIAKTIALNTNNTEEDVFALLNDGEYIDSLIEEYWFLTDEIKNDAIYYPLEGYLAPNTYQFASKNVTVDEIFRRMLNQTGKILTPYKDQLTDYTIHEYLTFASVVESEGLNDSDRAKIAGVFYNRLDLGMALESCVTGYYALKVDMGSQALSLTYLRSYVNQYNTYGPNMAGKLPVGPVSNPGVASIEATINPEDTDYLYFLSDKTKKTYFSKTYSEHLAKQAELKAADLWLEY